MENNLEDSFNQESPDKNPEPMSPDNHKHHMDDKTSFEHHYQETTKFIKEVPINTSNILIFLRAYLIFLGKKQEKFQHY